MFAALLRLMVFQQPPLLSDDYFRFWWDGHLVARGESPFLLTPSEYADLRFPDATEKEALNSMNSADRPTLYPPLLQGTWALGATASPDLPGWLLAMRCLYLSVDLVFLIILLKNASRIRGLKEMALLWAFHPLVVTEGCGNLHPEGLAVPLLAGSGLLLHQGKWKSANLLFGLSVATRLLPLIVLPAVWKARGFRRAARAAVVAILLTAGGYAVLTGVHGWHHIARGMDLYFREFEFNGSMYALARAAGTWICGYNPIAVTGPLLAAVAIAGITAAAWHLAPRYGMLPAVTAAWVIYFLCSTTVHPWYLMPLVPLAAVCNSPSLLAWTCAAMLSYQAYDPQWQSGWWTMLEYGLVAAFGAYEWHRRRQQNTAISC